MLKQIAILRERIEGRDTYPFSVPAIRTLRELKLRSRICFFAGENGSGKSTLLEALAFRKRRTRLSAQAPSPRSPNDKDLQNGLRAISGAAARRRLLAPTVRRTGPS